MRLIARFSKDFDLKYISHLDLLRLFQRALRRAQMPVAYSAGYNPHMLISFACALPVGVASDAEYIDMHLIQDISPEEFTEKMNTVLPEGVRILAAQELAQDFPSLTAITALSSYKLYLPEGFSWEGMEEKLAAFMARQDISIDKKSKSGVKLVNIRPMIHKLTLEEDGISAMLTAGNQYNLRADVFAAVLWEHLGIAEPALILRTALFGVHEGKVFEPIKKGEKP